MIKNESFRKGIFFSSIFSLVSKVLSFSQSMVLAYYFGTQTQTDVFFYCFATIGFISSILISLDSTVIIPESMRLSIQRSKEESMLFLNFFFYAYVFIGLIITVILIWEPVDTFYFLSSFNKTILQSQRDIIILSIPLLLLIVITSYFTDILTSYKYFTLPMIANMINSCLVLVFVFFFHEKLDVTSIFVGLLFGYFINLLFLMYMLRKIGWNYKFKLIKIDKHNWKNILFAQAGNFTTFLGSYIPLYLLSGMNSGVITALNYGQKLAVIPDQIFTTQVSAVSAIKMNELHASKENDKLNETFIKVTSMICFLLIPISLTFFVFSREIITLLFKRGAFNSYSVFITSEFLKYFGLLLPFLAINTLISRLMNAGQKVKANFFNQITVNILYFVLLFVFVKKWGAIGYPISMLIYLPMSVFIYSYFFLKHCFPEIKYVNIIRNVFKYFFINALILTPVVVLKSFGYSSISFMFCAIAYYFLAVLIFNAIFSLNTEVKLIINDITLKCYKKVKVSF